MFSVQPNGEKVQVCDATMLPAVHMLATEK
jgi:hypothetical protein